MSAAGFLYDSDLYNVGSTGLYWSISLITELSIGAYFLSFSSNYVYWDAFDHDNGLSVRPVLP